MRGRHHALRARQAEVAALASAAAEYRTPNSFAHSQCESWAAQIGYANRFGAADDATTTPTAAAAAECICSSSKVRKFEFQFGRMMMMMMISIIVLCCDVVVAVAVANQSGEFRFGAETWIASDQQIADQLIGARIGEHIARTRPPEGCNFACPARLLSAAKFAARIITADQLHGHNYTVAQTFITTHLSPR